MRPCYCLGPSIEGVCDEPEHAGAAQAAAPRPAGGLAVDPVALPEVDEVTISTLADNVFDTGEVDRTTDFVHGVPGRRGLRH